MNRRARCSVVGVLLALTAACSGTKVSAVTSIDGKALDGRGLYAANCAACHGANLRGTATGPPFLDAIYRPGHHAAAAFLFAVRNGAQPHHWNFGPMPPVTALTDAGGFTAEASIELAAPAARVWEALTVPALVKQYFFGTDLATDWKVGGPLTFSGMWEGRPYEDLGTVLEVEAPRRLSYTHWSALSGTPNTPEHQHTLVFTLDEHDGRTSVALTQDNAATEEEWNHSAAMWVMVLDGLKARRGRGGVGAAGDARVRRVKHRSSEGLNAE